MYKIPHPKFNLKSTKSETQTLIVLLFRYRGKLIKLSTQCFVHPCEWDQCRQRAVLQEGRNDLTALNKTLDKIAACCLDIYTAHGYGAIDAHDFKVELKRRLNKSSDNFDVVPHNTKPSTPQGLFEFIARELIEIEAAKMKKSSLKTFRTHSKILREFGEFIDPVNLFTYEDVDWQLRLRLIDWLADRKVQLAYGNKTLKVLRQFLESARRQKLHSHTDYQGKGWTVTRKKAHSQKVLFTEAELNILAALHLTGHLDKVRDICLIGAGTGQRFSDFSRYRPEQFSFSFHGVPLVSVISEKTDTLAKIPLNIFPWLIPVLEKHGYATPVMSMQKFNEGIKVLAEKAGFDDKLLVVHQYMGRKARVEKFYTEKYKLVASHLCRHSFATNLYRMGFKLSQIMPMTGHATEYQLREYIGIDGEQNAEDIGLMFMNRHQNSSNGSGILRAI